MWLDKFKKMLRDERNYPLLMIFFALVVLVIFTIFKYAREEYLLNEINNIYLEVEYERAKALKSDLEYYKKAVKEMERQEREGLNAK